MARRHTRFVRPPKSTKLWLGGAIGLTTIAPGPVLVSTLNAAALALRPFTILRTRVLLYVESDQSAASERNQGVYSKTVVSEAAAAAGIGSIPTPITEPDASYFVYQPFAFNFDLGDATGFIVTVQEYEIDSKAMRKVGNDDQLVGIVELQTSNGAIIAIQGRTLIQLH